MFRLTKKGLAIGLLCICVIGADITYGIFHTHPEIWGTFNCPQPPRNVGWENLTPQQRAHYGYPDPAAIKTNSQANNDYQLHGVHYCR